MVVRGGLVEPFVQWSQLFGPKSVRNWREKLV